MSEFIAKSGFLTLQNEKPIRKVINENLLDDLKEFFYRPKKNFRSQLVELGFSMVSSGRKPKALKIFQEALESIHAGSLIVDDVEDGSLIRRGKPSFHKLHGIARAINAGNYLYFLPIKKISEHKDIFYKQKYLFFEFYQEALYHAHLGQTLDLTVSISKNPKDKVYSLCLASMELKTGSLTAFALKSGAMLATQNISLINKIGKYGIKFGVALQQLDDIGNFLGSHDIEKQKEDLLNDRPTWIWAMLSKSPLPAWNSFLAAQRKLPEVNALKRWINEHEPLVKNFHDEAKEQLIQARKELERNTKNLNTKGLQNLEKKLLSSYT